MRASGTRMSSCICRTPFLVSEERIVAVRVPSITAVSHVPQIPSRQALGIQMSASSSASMVLTPQRPRP
jgi:hypothetical protein